MELRKVMTWKEGKRLWGSKLTVSLVTNTMRQEQRQIEGLLMARRVLDCELNKHRRNRNLLRKFLATRKGN